MLLNDSSQPERQSLLRSISIPNLTHKIIRSSDQYCEAGGFSDVFRCCYNSDDGVKEVAVKSFRFSFSVDDHKPDGGKVAVMVRRELGIWRRLTHPNIVPFLGIAYGFGKQASASLVSLWMPHGTLRAFLEAHMHQLAIQHRLQLLLDIANGLEYLHSFPVVHGDLSSNNVLLNHNYNACLSDFGCASLVGDHPEGFNYLRMSTVRPGTLRWAAPEHFSLREDYPKHTVQSDIYSFGNMALLTLSGKHPWSEIRFDAAVVLHLSQGHKPSRPLVRPIDDQHWALIEQCWSSVPERPLAKDLVSSLKRYLRTQPPSFPLRDIVGCPAASASISSRSGNDNSNYTEPTKSSITLHAPTFDMRPLLVQKCAEGVVNGFKDEFKEGIQAHLPVSGHQLDEPFSKRRLDAPIFDTISKNTIVVRGLPASLNEAQIYNFFQGFGQIKMFTLVAEYGNEPGKGVVVLEYIDRSVTEIVVQSTNGMKLGNQHLLVRKGGPFTVLDKIGKPQDFSRTNLISMNYEDPKKRPEHVRTGYYDSEHRVLEVYRILLSVLDSSSSMRCSLGSRLEVMQAKVADLANNAFSCGVRFGDLETAVELLEQGRTMLWNQLSRIDVSPVVLEYRNDSRRKELVKKFKQLSEDLKKHALGMGAKGMDPYWRVFERWESVVEEIRRQDGCSQFLLPSSFENLQKAAERGPVIIVNGSKHGCDVIIVLNSRPPVHVPLECSLDDVTQLCTQFLEFSQNPNVYGESREFWIKRALRGLWSLMVEWIVTTLQDQIRLPLGSRIWWYPTWKLTILPFHAAGPYQKDKKNLMDMYISSYAPSLLALVRSRERAHAQKNDQIASGTSDAISFAAICQAKASADLKLGEIPFVEVEIERIRDETGMPPCVSFNSITGDVATIDGAIREFRDHRWVHLACHGVQHPTKPFESFFAMRDGPLTLHRIIQERYAHSEFAFLSSCHTAAGDQSTPDEVLHLAAGMQFAGFNGVIGTLWTVDDGTTHQVVTRFYREMFRHPDVDFEHAAAALNVAIAQSARDVPLETQIAFVHIGI